MIRVRRVVATTATATSVLAGCLLVDPFPDVLPERTSTDATSAPETSEATLSPPDGCVDAGDPSACGPCGRRCATGYACLDGRCANDVVEMAAGGEHTCAAVASGEVYCWGDPSSGQTGARDAGDDLLARPIPLDALGTPVRAAALAAGADHTCALRPDGSLRCWGSQVHGALSNNRTSPDGGPSFEPIPQVAFQFPGGAGRVPYTALAQGALADHACSTDAKGRAFCWGANDHGQLGPTSGGTLADCAGNTGGCRALPSEISGVASVVQLAVGATHTCALDAAGAVWCWGYNFLGGLGTGSRGLACGAPCAGEPPSRVKVGRAKIVATGSETSCAVLEDESVWCWGKNTSGVLGHASPDDARGTRCCFSTTACAAYCNPTPTKVDGVTGAVTVTLGAGHACALLRDGTLRCWGANAFGQLGAGDDASSPAPRSVTGLSGAAGVVAGMRHTCAWTQTGEVWCWGAANAIGSDPTLGNALTPRRVARLP
ncbi:MAG: hypothetical protein JST00_12350 [Deltaproteobacteria bacterium]|nr:hypothetical protein [Deltaproteobacteria bacterium]